MDLKICAKKLVMIGPDLHQKYYGNRIIFRKYMTFSNCTIFCLTLLYLIRLFQKTKTSLFRGRGSYLMGSALEYSSG
eukprot:UN22316